MPLSFFFLIILFLATLDTHLLYSGKQIKQRTGSLYKYCSPVWIYACVLVCRPLPGPGSSLRAFYSQSNIQRVELPSSLLQTTISRKTRALKQKLSTCGGWGRMDRWRKQKRITCESKMSRSGPRSAKICSFVSQFIVAGPSLRQSGEFGLTDASPGTFSGSPQHQISLAQSGNRTWWDKYAKVSFYSGCCCGQIVLMWLGKTNTAC